MLVRNIHHLAPAVLPSTIHYPPSTSFSLRVLCLHSLALFAWYLHSKFIPRKVGMSGS